MHIPLVNVFDSGLQYAFEKVGQGIYSGTTNSLEFGRDMLGAIRKTYEKFQQELSSINECDSSLEFELNEYFHAISKLDAYFKKTSSDFIKLDALIYLYFIEENHQKFHKIAKEIDDKYAEEKI